MNCSCFSKDWQLRVFLETQWNLDLDIRKILQLLNLWGLLDNNSCPFFTLRGPQPLGWMEFYRLNVNCFSQACMLYSWSTIFSDFGKMGVRFYMNEIGHGVCFPGSILFLALVSIPAFVTYPPKYELFLLHTHAALLLYLITSPMKIENSNHELKPL